MPHQLVQKAKFMAIVTVGIDLAKNVFAVHGVDETGKPALVRPNQQVGRAVAGPRRLLEGHRRHCGEERSHVLGRAGQRREFQVAGLSAGVPFTA